MQIAPSLMCANQLELLNNVTALLKLGVDRLHLDVMDGQFVGNLALTFDIVKKIRPLTRLPLDVHLMVQKPSAYFDRLIEHGADTIIFHVETSEDIEKNLDYLKSRGVQTGLALHLDTPVSAVEPFLAKVDFVLLMNVTTGYSGLKFDERVLEKSHALYSYVTQKKLGVQIISDGGIRLEHVEPLYKKGAEIVVAGTSMLFNDRGFSKNIGEYKKIAAELKKRDAAISSPDFSTQYQAAVLAEVKKFAVQSKTLRQLKPGEVVVQVMSCGICGSDLERVYKNGMYSKNLVPGHEFSGIVVKAAPDSKEWLNRRVAVFPLIACEAYLFCRQQKFNLCEKYDYLGSRSDGGFAELVVAPAKNLVAIPNNVTHDEASLIEPMAVVYHGLRKISSLPGATVLVLGLGPIGILAGMLSKKMGCKNVIGIDRNTHKREAATKAGFSRVFAPEKADLTQKPTVLIDASGASELLDRFFPLIAKESAVLLLANHAKDLVLSSKTMSSILRGEHRIFSSWNSTITEHENNDWKVCVDYLASGEINVLPLISHKFGLSQIVRVFDQMHDKKLPYIKVVINPSE